MLNNMAGWRLILKGQQILQLGHGVKNVHQLSLKSSVSYPTARRYIEMPEQVQVIDAIVLPNLLIQGLGMTPDEVANLRVGDLFDIVEDKGDAG